MTLTGELSRSAIPDMSKNAVIPLEFHSDFWHRKTRIPGLLYGIVCVILGLAILVNKRHATDTR